MEIVVKRTSSTPSYTDTKGNLLSQRWRKIAKETPATELILSRDMTLYSLSLQHYGSPLFYWLIADFNDILDPDITLKGGATVKLPIIT